MKNTVFALAVITAMVGCAHQGAEKMTKQEINAEMMAVNAQMQHQQIQEQLISGNIVRPELKVPNTLQVQSRNVINGHSFASQQVFKGFGCTGNNISPQISWSNAPANTKSFMVTLFDPDAPTGSGWWHWVVHDIPANQHNLPLNAGAIGAKNLPKGAKMVTNDFGYAGFGGPCPPQGSAAHNYQLTVYALDVEKLDVDKNASPALVTYEMFPHAIAKGVITAPTKIRN